MLHVYGVGSAVVTALPNCRRVPNLNRIPYVTEEDECLSMRWTANEIRHLSHEFMQWWRQTDGVATKYRTSCRHVQVFLHYLARGGYYHQVGCAEGLSESGTIMHLQYICLLSKHSSTVRFLTMLFFYLLMMSCSYINVHTEKVACSNARINYYQHKPFC